MLALSSRALMAIAVVMTLFLTPQPGKAADPLPVFVSIVPQKYFIERLAGEAVDVSVMVSPGASPATYEPKPKQMAMLSKASLYFAIGVPFEQSWLPRIAAANTAMQVVHMDQGLKKLPMAAHHHHHDDHSHAAHEGHDHHTEHGHSHDHDDHAHHAKKHDHDDHAHNEKHSAGHEEHSHAGHDDHAEHGHMHDHDAAHHDDHAHKKHDHGEMHAGGLDPHVWLSPAFVKQMALTARKALTNALPEHAAQIRSNYRDLVKDIDMLDEELFAVFANIPQKDRNFMVFHPSWGYFAQSYALTQIPIEYEGKEPSPKQLAALIKKAQEHNITTIFVQPQFNRKSAETIARQINGRVLIADPLAYDWPKNLRHVAAEFASSFK